MWIKAGYQFQFGVLEQWGVIGGNFKDLKMCTLKLFWAWRTEKGSSRYGMGLDSAFLDICTENFHCTI